MFVWFRGTVLFVVALVILTLGAMSVFATLPVCAFETPIPPSPTAPLVDLAGIVDEASARNIETIATETLRLTNVPIYVLTLASIGSDSIEDFGLAVYRKWGIGFEETNEGVLLLVVMDLKKFRFDVGYGSEGYLNDAKVGDIGRQCLAPAFRAARFGEGITCAVRSLAAEAAREHGVELSGLPQAAPVSSPSGKKTTTFQKIVSILIALALIALFIRHPRLFLLLLLSSRGGSGGRGGGFGGGGFGGGGFGGLGGGSAGGGGATGGW